MNNQRLEALEGINLSRREEEDCNASLDFEKKIPLDDSEQTERPQPKPPDIPPDGGYGWVCVACVFLINGHTWGKHQARFLPLPLKHSLMTLSLIFWTNFAC
jgi:hypothetical protein